MGQANVFLMLTQLGVCQQIEGEDSKLSGQELCSGEAHTAWCQSQVRCQARSKMNVSSQDISLRWEHHRIEVSILFRFAVQPWYSPVWSSKAYKFQNISSRCRDPPWQRPPKERNWSCLHFVNDLPRKSPISLRVLTPGKFFFFFFWSLHLQTRYGGFLELVYPQIIHYIDGFSLINRPFWIPQFMETSTNLNRNPILPEFGLSKTKQLQKPIVSNDQWAWAKMWQWHVMIIFNSYYKGSIVSR